MDLIIDNLTREQNTEVVTDVFWRFTKTENGKTVSINGSSTLPAVDTSTKPFINYNLLTEETVKGWIKEILTPQGVQNMSNQLNNLIANNPTQDSIKGIPWTPSNPPIKAEVVE
jgi:hypothetical protein